MLDHVSLARYLAQPLVDEAAKRVEPLAFDGHVEQIVQLGDADPGVHHEIVVGDALYPGLAHVELVLDLTDDLLQEVLDRHEAGDSAVLVDHDGHLDAPALELAQELLEGLSLGNEHGRPDHALDR